MKSEAVERIQRVISEGARDLNLNWLGLTVLPIELFDCQTITSLDLSYNHIGDEARALATLTKLTTLNLGRNQIGAEGARALSALTKLTSLNLDDNQIGAEGARALASLTKLTSLSLFESLIGDEGARALATLTKLTTLNLGRNQIGDEGARALAALTKLTTLNLSLNHIRDEGARALATLTKLTALYLHDNQIGADGAGALAALTKLTSLYLSANQIGDEGAHALASLTKLTALNLGRNQIGAEGARALATLTKLTSLYLGDNQIGDEGTRALAMLTNLTTLYLFNNQIGDEGARALAAPTKLTSLDLSSNQIGDEGARALATLTNLTSLNLSSNQIGDEGARALAALTNLTMLNISDNPNIVTFAPLVPLLEKLEELYLFDCNFTDIPRELCGEHSASNVIASVRAHFRDIARGQERDAELKVCVLGNGGVGKTQMCRRLRDLPFDPSVPTTHGIQLGHLDLTLDGDPVHLNLWDFGGQDIYHGSHALFLQGPAVFVILWNPDRESGCVVDGGATIEHRPLSFWLDFVRGLSGTDNPLLVVQSQCNDPQSRCNPNIPLEEFPSPRPLGFSAKTDFGLGVLRGELEDAVRLLRTRQPAMIIGQGRREIRDQLRTMLEADQQLDASQRRHRTLTLEAFRKLCEENGKISSPEALLDYLHRTGVVFYQPGLFDGKIILDQNWALEAIYTLFDRKRTFPILNRHGRFTRRELDLLVWNKFAVEEQELFLSMMESCGICFKARSLSGDPNESEWEYLAPELLPEWSVAQDWLLGRMQGGREEVRAEVTYPFLHEGIVRAFLSRIGEKAGDAPVFWKYGCWFWEKTSESQILIRSQVDASSGKGTVTLRAMGVRPRDLLDAMLAVLLPLSIGRPPEVSRSWEASAPHSRMESMPVGASLKSLEVTDRPNPPEAGKTSIYVSFAWGDDVTDAGRQREAVVRGLCEMLDRSGYEVLRDDRELKHGEWISTFMKAIGRGDHVLVILSDKYLRSPFCMTELAYTYNRSLGEKREFLDRVIPVVVEKVLNLGDWRTPIACIDYWQKELMEMEPHLSKFGRPQFELYRMIKDWQSKVGDMLGFISDVLKPQGFDAIFKDDYAAVREMLPLV
jgi:internalin A